MPRIQVLLGLLMAVSAISCGPSETVTVGGPDAKPGVVRRDIDTAHTVQTASNARVAADNAELDR